jgi:hypothetical protein
MRIFKSLTSVFFVALSLATFTAPGQERAANVPPPSCAGQPARDESLRRELLGMYEADQAVRRRWIESKYSEATGREMLALDEKNVARLGAIFKAHGFPGLCLVGLDGAQAAHTLMLHSPSLEIKKEALPHLEAAAKRGEVPQWAVAMTVDKILVSEGKPQLYGSAVEFVDGKIVLKPISDPERLDERRAKVGLPPLKESMKVFEEMYRMPAAPTPTPTPPAKQKP